MIATLPFLFLMAAVALLIVAYQAFRIHRDPIGFSPLAQRIAHRIYRDGSEPMIVFGAAVLVVLGMISALPQLGPITYAGTLAVFLIGFVLIVLVTRRQVGLLTGVPLVAVVVVVTSVLFVDPYRDRILDLIGQLHEVKIGNLDVALLEDQSSRNKFPLEQEIQRTDVAQQLNSIPEVADAYIGSMESDASLIRAMLTFCLKTSKECENDKLKKQIHNLELSESYLRLWSNQYSFLMNEVTAGSETTDSTDARKAARASMLALCHLEQRTEGGTPTGEILQKVPYTYIIDALLHINLAWTYRDSGVAESAPNDCKFLLTGRQGEELARWHEYKAFAQLTKALTKGPKPDTPEDNLLYNLWELNLHYIIGQVSIATYNARDVSLEATKRSLDIARELQSTVKKIPTQDYASEETQTKLKMRFDRSIRYLENTIAYRWAVRRNRLNESDARAYSRDAACDFADANEDGGSVVEGIRKKPLTCPDSDMLPQFLDTRGVVLLNYAIMHLTDDQLVLREERIRYRHDIMRAQAFFNEALKILLPQAQMAPNEDFVGGQITLVRGHEKTAQRALANL